MARQCSNKPSDKLWTRAFTTQVRWPFFASKPASPTAGPLPCPSNSPTTSAIAMCCPMTSEVMMNDLIESLRRIGLRAPKDVLEALLTHAHKSRQSPAEFVEHLVAVELRERDA